MSYECILFDAAEGVATITFNRPTKLNAFNGTMLAEISDAVDRAAADTAVRALLVTGTGRGFCSGQDLGDRMLNPGDKPRDLGETLDKTYNPLVRKLRGLEMPVVVAVNGIAAGAGANFALSGDIVLAARSASFIQAFSRVGLVPDCGGTYYLPRLVGTARAMGLAMLGEALPAEQAAEWGLIWKCVDDDKLTNEATTLARRLANGPTLALALIKQAVHAAATSSLDAQLDLEAASQRKAGYSEDYREGVAAFLEKRPAGFKGR